jgi:metal-responsive CopG/Arc/MetJ family transcriptional regulator
MSFMPTKKPKLIMVMEDELLTRIDDFRFENRINSRSEAIRQLIEVGLKVLSKGTKEEAGIYFQKGGPLCRHRGG